jgi:hypothetical protein
MSNKKETAVEWLFNQIPDHLRLTQSGFEMLQQAKELEKQEIIDAYWDGTAQFANDARIDYPKTPEQYYKETYEQ